MNKPLPIAKHTYTINGHTYKLAPHCTYTHVPCPGNPYTQTIYVRQETMVSDGCSQVPAKPMQP